jgi:hypothetical protein
MKIDDNVSVEFSLAWRVAGKCIAYAINFFKIPVYGITITITKEDKTKES